MIKKPYLQLFGIFALAFSIVCDAQLSLRINGDLVAPSGDIKSFAYSGDSANPGQVKVEIGSFHKDIRCSAESPQAGGNITLFLDRFGPSEEDASYVIPLDGLISYSPQDGVIDIVGDTIEASENIDCTHKFPSVGEIDPQSGAPTLGATAVYGFENMFDIKAIRASAGVGFDLILENQAPLFAAKDVRVPLTITLDTGIFPQPDPDFTSLLVVDDPATTEVLETVPFGTVNLQTGEWQLPALWAFETAILEVRYVGLQPSDEISLQVNQVLAQDRGLTLPEPLITVVNTSTSSIVGAP